MVKTFNQNRNHRQKVANIKKFDKVMNELLYLTLMKALSTARPLSKRYMFPPMTVGEFYKALRVPNNNIVSNYKPLSWSSIGCQVVLCR